MNNLNIEDLKHSVKLFSAAQCDFLSENCIVAFENNNHFSGCKLSVVGDCKEDLLINWSRAFSRAGYREEKKVIEHAAETISFFISTRCTEYTIIEEATIGTGFDYWLGYDESHQLYNPRNFLQARLEISGINKESPTNTLDKRVREKKDQTGRSDGTNLPAYVSVVEFSTPKAYFGRK